MNVKELIAQVCRNEEEKIALFMRLSQEFFESYDKTSDKGAECLN